MKKKMWVKWFVVVVFPVVVLFSTGCAALNRQKNAATDVAESYEANRTERMKVAIQEAARASESTGKDAVVESETTDVTGAKGDQSLTYEWKSSIPIVVVALLWLVAVVGVSIFYQIARKKSLAVRAVSDLAEQQIAEKVRRLRQRLNDQSLSVDQKVWVASEIAEMESDRGKLKATLTS